MTALISFIQKLTNMKQVLLFSFVLLIAFAFTKEENSNTDAINPIIGDISYLEKFGEAPNQTTDEQLRIQTHLEYVEQLLRKKDLNH